ncbi:MAG: methyltransferase family protein, partial [Terriglobales bacterium]
AIIILGFWAPWIGVVAPPKGFASRISLLEWLSSTTSRMGLMSFTHAAPLVIVLGTLVAGLAVVLRVWGAAYLGPAIVQHGEMQADAVMAGGPYRYVRNPLYLGLWLMVAAMALIMPPTGAVFSLVMISLFLFRLILGEEAFLSDHLGERYRIYSLAVPRLFPRLRSALPRAGQKPQWLRAIFSELLPVGIFLTLAVVSWSYNNRMMGRAILISFGVSLVARALLPGDPAPSSKPE